VLLPVLHHFAEHFTGLIVLHHRTQWHLDDLVLTGLSRALVAGAHPAIIGDHVFGVAQVQQGPQLGIAAQDDVTAAAAITAIGAALGHVLLAAEVAAALPPFPGAALDADVVDEVHTGVKVGIVAQAKFAPCLGSVSAPLGIS